ncbi:RagB/SusD family nutrient uptake outer membrane protein [Niabella aurantiaca]|uniref:RagB/SusD family nutrient uptake outer membrane protein n=1 Tax=Niabella aurantiaca TaxID=379900 RepID=UPI000379CEC2|nr:RagB/SusD family nutrient uptake outer membrane protein [Niabella aurantiaca]
MKKYIIHNYLRWMLLLTVLFLSVLTGCKKFLDVDRQGSYTADDYPYPGGSGPYDQFIFGAYNDLRSYNVHADGFIVATSIRSDDADKGSTPSDGGTDVITMDNFPVTPSNGRCNSLWTGYYGLINKCNSAIANIDTNATIVASDAIKLQSKAEVRFLRGYAYFMLVRLFGGVPKIDTVYKDVASTPLQDRSPVAEIYAFIEEDLNFAKNNLPAEWDRSKFPGRITKGAAEGMLAKVYLTQKKWAQAMTEAQSVMNSGQYDLSVSYNTVFSEEGENSKESVFEVQATASPTVREANGVQYASIQGVRGPNNWNLGWGWNSPSVFLVNAYEPGDPRKNRTIFFASTAAATNTSIFGETTPIYPTQVPNERYNQKVLGNPSLRNSISRGCWWMNVRILRYADVVLMFAEAANELGGEGNIAAARTALNSVRARARQGAAAGVLPDVTATTQEELRTAIRHERRIELAMEHDRFFDLVRWGIAAEALNASGKPNFSDARDVLLPIPQTQRDLNGKLTQNPGY